MIILKNENELYELRTAVELNKVGVKNLEVADVKNKEFLKVIRGGGNLDSKEIIEVVMGIVRELMVSMVHRDEFMGMRAETGTLQKQLNDLKEFRQKIESQCIDDHFKIINKEHALQEHGIRMDHLSCELNDARSKI